ncbi:MAG: SUMF1/EgtB/PvdO family nonheme iron enzyme, partial [Firmicutes bacterium]|nr:SUMF1/EgtB/PvdO family nonheme iron enzyme [Bacillota bacterium]
MKKYWVIAIVIIIIISIGVILFYTKTNPDTIKIEQTESKQGMVIIPAKNIDMPVNSGKTESFNLSSFYIDKYPVTNRQYLDYLRKSTPSTKEDKEREIEGMPDEKLDFPVVRVSYNDAESYAQFYEKRLPTEAEWYLAASGGDGREYPWGNQWDDKLVEPENIGGRSVGKNKNGESPFGVADLVGNVFQWTCSSYFLENNVVGPEFGGKMRVVRAGACTYMPAWNKCSFRAAVRESEITSVIGFRCVKPIGGKDKNLELEKNRKTVFIEGDFNYSEGLRQMISCGIYRKPDSLLESYIAENVKKSDVVADIASGIGFLTFYLSDITGAKGKVYAVDIDESVLDFVKVYSEKKGMTNVFTIVSQPADTMLPENS